MMQPNRRQILTTFLLPQKIQATGQVQSNNECENRRSKVISVMSVEKGSILWGTMKSWGMVCQYIKTSCICGWLHI